MFPLSLLGSEAVKADEKEATAEAAAAAVEGVEVDPAIAEAAAAAKAEREAAAKVGSGACFLWRGGGGARADSAQGWASSLGQACCGGGLLEGICGAPCPRAASAAEAVEARGQPSLTPPSSITGTPPCLPAHPLACLLASIAVGRKMTVAPAAHHPPPPYLPLCCAPAPWAP